MRELTEDINDTITAIVNRILGRGGEESEDDAVTGETAADDRTEDESDSATIGGTKASEGARESGLAICSLTATTTGDGLTRTDGTSDVADPVNHTPERSTACAHESRLNPPPDLEPADLTEQQRETLRAIHDQPTATQADLGDELGVTSATISQRVNSIDGFDWSKRRAFTEVLFGQREAASGVLEDDGSNTVDTVVESLGDITVPMPESNDTNSDLGETNADSDDQYCEALTNQVRELTEQVQTLEQQLETQSTVPDTILADPELAHKVLHACFTSDQISEEEELQILERIIH